MLQGEDLDMKVDFRVRLRSQIDLSVLSLCLAAQVWNRQGVAY